MDNILSGQELQDIKFTDIVSTTAQISEYIEKNNGHIPTFDYLDTEENVFLKLNSSDWVKSNIDFKIHKVISDGNKYIAVTQNKGIAYSFDGKTWISSNIKYGWFWDICWNGSKTKPVYLATSKYYGQSTNYIFGIFKSTDGINWKLSKDLTDIVPSSPYITVSCKDNLCVAAYDVPISGKPNSGKIFYSIDGGEIWKESNLPSVKNGSSTGILKCLLVKKVDGTPLVIVSVRNNILYYKQAKINDKWGTIEWETCQGKVENEPSKDFLLNDDGTPKESAFWDIIYDGTIFLASAYGSWEDGIIWSDDGIIWNKANGDVSFGYHQYQHWTRECLTFSTFGNKKIYFTCNSFSAEAYGLDGVQYSEDGKKWHNFGLNNINIRYLFIADDKLFAVATSGTIFYNNLRINKDQKEYVDDKLKGEVSDYDNLPVENISNGDTYWLSSEQMFFTYNSLSSNWIPITSSKLYSIDRSTSLEVDDSLSRAKLNFSTGSHWAPIKTGINFIKFDARKTPEGILKVVYSKSEQCYWICTTQGLYRTYNEDLSECEQMFIDKLWNSSLSASLPTNYQWTRIQTFDEIGQQEYLVAAAVKRNSDTNNDALDSKLFYINTITGICETLKDPKTHKDLFITNWIKDSVQINNDGTNVDFIYSHGSYELQYIKYNKELKTLLNYKKLNNIINELSSNGSLVGIRKLIKFDDKIFMAGQVAYGSRPIDIKNFNTFYLDISTIYSAINSNNNINAKYISELKGCKNFNMRVVPENETSSLYITGLKWTSSFDGNTGLYKITHGDSTHDLNVTNLLANDSQLSSNFEYIKDYYEYKYIKNKNIEGEEKRINVKLYVGVKGTYNNNNIYSKIQPCYIFYKINDGTEQPIVETSFNTGIEDFPRFREINNYITVNSIRTDTNSTEIAELDITSKQVSPYLANLDDIKVKHIKLNNVVQPIDKNGIVEVSVDVDHYFENVVHKTGNENIHGRKNIDDIGLANVSNIHPTYYNIPGHTDYHFVSAKNNNKKILPGSTVFELKILSSDIVFNKDIFTAQFTDDIINNISLQIDNNNDNKLFKVIVNPNSIWNNTYKFADITFEYDVPYYINCALNVENYGKTKKIIFDVSINGKSVYWLASDTDNSIYYKSKLNYDFRFSYLGSALYDFYINKNLFKVMVEDKRLKFDTIIIDSKLKVLTDLQSVTETDKTKKQGVENTLTYTGLKTKYVQYDCNPNTGEILSSILDKTVELDTDRINIIRKTSEESDLSSITLNFPNKKSGEYTFATLDDIKVDTNIVHLSGNEQLSGNLSSKNNIIFNRPSDNKQIRIDSLSSTIIETGNGTTYSIIQKNNDQKIRLIHEETNKNKQGGIELITNGSKIVLSSGDTPIQLSSGIKLNNKKIEGVSFPTENNDAVNKKYVDDKIDSIVIPEVNLSNYVDISSNQSINGEKSLYTKLLVNNIDTNLGLVFDKEYTALDIQTGKIQYDLLKFRIDDRHPINNRPNSCAGIFKLNIKKSFIGNPKKILTIGLWNGGTSYLNVYEDLTIKYANGENSNTNWTNGNFENIIHTPTKLEIGKDYYISFNIENRNGIVYYDFRINKSSILTFNSKTSSADIQGIELSLFVDDPEHDDYICSNYAKFHEHLSEKFLNYLIDNDLEFFSNGKFKNVSDGINLNDTTFSTTKTSFTDTQLVTKKYVDDMNDSCIHTYTNEISSGNIILDESKTLYKINNSTNPELNLTIDTTNINGKLSENSIIMIWVMITGTKKFTLTTPPNYIWVGNKPELHDGKNNYKVFLALMSEDRGNHYLINTQAVWSY